MLEFGLKLAFASGTRSQLSGTAFAP